MREIFDNWFGYKISWWEEQRKNGKFYWITKTALVWGFFVFSFSSLFAWFFGNETYISISSLLLLITFGFGIGIYGWWINEGKYQNYLLDEKIKKGLHASTNDYINVQEKENEVIERQNY